MVIIAILLVVLILAVAAFFFLQQFMVYTDDGQWHLELPFLNRQEAMETPPPVESQTVVIVTPSPTPAPTPTPNPAPPNKGGWGLRYDKTQGTAAAQVP